jgi:hypothetical protein
MNLWKVPRALHNPHDITLYANTPHGMIKVVFKMSSFASQNMISMDIYSIWMHQFG